MYLKNFHICLPWKQVTHGNRTRNETTPDWTSSELVAQYLAASVIKWQWSKQLPLIIKPLIMHQKTCRCLFTLETGDSNARASSRALARFVYKHPWAKSKNMCIQCCLQKLSISCTEEKKKGRRRKNSIQIHLRQIALWESRQRLCYAERGISVVLCALFVYES